MPLCLAWLLQELKVVNGEAFFTLRKKYCECDVKDKRSELSKHVTSVGMEKDCLRSGMSLSEDLHVDRVTLTRMTYLG